MKFISGIKYIPNIRNLHICITKNKEQFYMEYYS